MTRRRIYECWIGCALKACASIILLAGSVEAGSLTLAWDLNPDPSVIGYVVHYGTASGVYGTHVDAGHVTTWTQTGLTNGQRYYFAVTAYDGSGQQGPSTVEVSAVVVAPDLTITSAHAGGLTQGQIGATYTLTVSNVGAAPSAGPVTVVDTLPAGLTATAISGAGWNCTLATLTCVNTSQLAGNASFPAITLTVTVADTAASSVTNTAAVSGGGESNTSNNTGSSASTVTPVVARVAINPTTATLNAGGTVNLAGQAFDAANNPMPSAALTWATSNAAVASLASASGATGTVTAVGAGTTTITVSSGGKSAAATVTVNPQPAVNRVTITPATATLAIAQAQQFVALAYDASDAPISGVAFTWTTTNSSVAPLSTAAGATVVVTPQSGGTATLRATATSNGTYAQATVTVTQPQVVTRVTVTPSNPAVTLGWRQTLVARAYDASDNLVPAASFTWTPTNSTIARLLTTGGSTVEMIGYGLGTATLTARETTSNRTGNASVTVSVADTLVWDTFTGTNGTLLSAHAPDMNLIGSIWSNAGTSAALIQGGLARVTGSGSVTSYVYTTIDATAADVRLATDWKAQSATPFGGLAFRWSDSNNFLFAGYLATNELAIYQVQNGAATRMVGAPFAPASGTTYALEVVASGTALQMFVNGALQLQASSSFNQSVTRHGLMWANGVDTLSGYDHFRVTGTSLPPPAPPAPAPPPPPPPPPPVSVPEPVPSPAPSPAPSPSSPAASTGASSSPAPAPVSSAPSPSPTPASTTSSPTQPTSPSAPGGLVSSVSGATVVLQWSAGAGGNYVIEAGSSSGTADLARLEVGSETSFTVSPVPPGRYFVRVRAVTNGVPSAASNEVIVNVGGSAPLGCTASPASPGGLTFMVRGSDVSLNWSNGGGDVSSYVLEAGSFPGAANLANIDTVSSATSFFAADVAAGTYFVRVRSKNSCGVSGGSNEVVLSVVR